MATDTTGRSACARCWPRSGGPTRTSTESRTFPRSRCGSREWSRLATRRVHSGGGEIDDSGILQRIGELVDDEHRLFEKGEEHHGLNEDDEARLRGLEVAL